MVICLERHADLHMAQLKPLPLTVSCFSKIQIGLTFLIPAHLGSPGNVCVYTDGAEAVLLVKYVGKMTHCLISHQQFARNYKNWLRCIKAVPYHSVCIISLFI